MPMNRTQEEILARIEERRKEDFFGFERSDLLEHLEYKHAKPFLKEGVTEDQWADRGEVQDPIEELKDYMSFAWEKANNQRGLSANRSIHHCVAWLWLAGEDEILAKVENEYAHNYQYYGKDILSMICDHFGLDWKQWDDGERSNG